MKKPKIVSIASNGVGERTKPRAITQGDLKGIIYDSEAYNARLAREAAEEHARRASRGGKNSAQTRLDNNLKDRERAARALNRLRGANGDIEAFKLQKIADTCGLTLRRVKEFTLWGIRTDAEYLRRGRKLKARPTK